MEKIVVDLQSLPATLSAASKYVPVRRVRRAKDLSTLQIYPSPAQKAELDRITQWESAHFTFESFEDKYFVKSRVMPVVRKRTEQVYERVLLVDVIFELSDDVIIRKQKF